MIFILIFMWSGIIEHKAFAKQSKDLSSKELEQRANKLESLFDALEEATQELPRDTFDPNAIIEKVGKDPMKLFEWVRDNTYLVPYQGSLRGDIGVLMDRLGNSLDRALLLHELLHLAGHSVRIVRGNLSINQTKNLFKNIRMHLDKRSKKSTQIPYQAIKDIIEKYAHKYDLNSIDSQNIIQKMILEQSKQTEELVDRVKVQSSELMDKVTKNINIAESEEINTAYEMMQDHWWVQWENTGSWKDLDPTMSNANPGEILTEAIDNYEPDELDEDFFHLVKIRVIIERWESGSLKEDLALEYSIRPSEFFGKNITLNHYPLNWPEDLVPFKEKNPTQKMKAVLLEQKEWLPILIVGPDKITASSFKHSGKINDNPGAKEKQGVSGVTRGLFNALAGGEEKEEDSQLTAEWIEYEIYSPGKSRKKIRRKIFDLIGPVARSLDSVPKPNVDKAQNLEWCLALLSDIKILIQVCSLSPNYLINLTAKRLLANRSILPDLLRKGNSLKHKDLIQELSKLSALPGPEFGLALARQKWSHFSNDIYLDQPNILSYWTGVQQITQDEFSIYRSFDIVHNSVAVHPTAEVDPFQIRLEQGVIDSTTEAFLLKSKEKVSDNTAEIFAEAKSRGIDSILIKDPSDLNSEGINLPQEIKIQIERDLMEGYIVIVPKNLVPIKDQKLCGWWRLNPTSGSNLGLTQSGKGGAQDTVDAVILFIVPGLLGGGLYLVVCASRNVKDKTLCLICGGLVALAFPVTILVALISEGLAGGYIVAFLVTVILAPLCA